MADFSNVSVALNADGRTLDLSGQALVEQSQPVEVTTTVRALVDGSTKVFVTDGVEVDVLPSETVIDSVTDSLGHTYAISPDGQHASH